MAKRATGLGLKNRKKSPHKTVKRLAAKKVMLAAKKTNHSNKK